MVNDINSYLSQYREEMPKWLENYSEKTPLSFSEIMSGRIGYYPGSGFDGKGGILDAIIIENNVRPQYVLCAENARIWNGYKCIIEDLPLFRNVLHCVHMRLYKKE